MGSQNLLGWELGDCLWASLHPTHPDPTAGVDHLCVDKIRFQMHRRGNVTTRDGKHYANPAGLGPGFGSQASLNNLLFPLDFSEGCWRAADPDP